ncbi:PAS domain S-box protein [Mucilaginibacter litoreus]|uniref:PAS domain S-box protein n=1 Tax=Mucilaginibacter litoreus TaxID=1048221 RepID=A0ABW3AQ96_9SPHI
MRLGPLKIAGLYIIAGILWITLSDKLLQVLQTRFDLSTVLFIGSIKGIVYVLLTGILLYYLIRLHTSRLTESEERYRSYFEDYPYPMWIIDLRTMAFLAVNEAAIAQYGYSRDEFLHMNVLDICPPADVNAVYTAFRELKPGINNNVSWHHRQKDGTVVNVNVTSHLIKTRKGGHLMAMAKEVDI